MKVVLVDNYDRGIRADTLIAEGLSLDGAEALAAEKNARCPDYDFYRVVAEDYVLFPGFEP